MRQHGRAHEMGGNQSDTVARSGEGRGDVAGHARELTREGGKQETDERRRGNGAVARRRGGEAEPHADSSVPTRTVAGQRCRRS